MFLSRMNSPSDVWRLLSHSFVVVALLNCVVLCRNVDRPELCQISLYDFQKFLQMDQKVPSRLSPLRTNDSLKFCCCPHVFVSVKSQLIYFVVFVVLLFLCYCHVSCCHVDVISVCPCVSQWFVGRLRVPELRVLFPSASCSCWRVIRSSMFTTPL